MIVVGIDPSMSRCGFASLRFPSPNSPRLAAPLHQFRPLGPDHDLYDRARSIIMATRGWLNSLPDAPDLIAVEGPQSIARNLKGKRSMATLPMYGVAIGAAMAGVREWTLSRNGEPPTIQTVSATDWTRLMPGTRSDPRKDNRRAFVASLLGVDAIDVPGPDAADAALMAIWAGAALTPA